MNFWPLGSVGIRYAIHAWHASTWQSLPQSNLERVIEQWAGGPTYSRTWQKRNFWSFRRNLAETPGFHWLLYHVIPCKIPMNPYPIFLNFSVQHEVKKKGRDLWTGAKHFGNPWGQFFCPGPVFKNAWWIPSRSRGMTYRGCLSMPTPDETNNHGLLIWELLQ